MIDPDAANIEALLLSSMCKVVAYLQVSPIVVCILLYFLKHVTILATERRKKFPHRHFQGG